MNRDPFYQKIIERLTQVTDGNLFEDCAVDLLRPEWPNMVPVPGGDDAGLDGAWVDDVGRGLLVSTVGTKVLANVKRNLTKHKEAGGKSRRVLVATTQKLSARQCRNIEKAINELGYELAHQPYTREAIAARLYHNSRWCSDLLNLAGTASAIGRIPKSARPLRDLPLIGRVEDLAWLTSTTGDRVISGQPGIGKTFLMQAYVNVGKGLFVIEADIQRLAGALRDQDPSALVVEDAHLRLELLDDLRRFRDESGLTFDIIADCWPAESGKVIHALSLTESSCRTLEPLSPKEIVEVIHAAGIGGPNELMHQLVRQAAGCPGLAAMLVHHCMSASTREVWEGKPLLRWAQSTFENTMGKRAIQLLASFSIGGKSGLAISDVAAIQEFPIGDVRETMAQLAFGGVVQELGPDVLCVLPEPLRCALVKEHFFDREVKLPLEHFAARTRSIGSTINTLIGVYGRGARTASQTIVELLPRCSEAAVWENFVWVDAAHAELVITRFPDQISTLARSLLNQAPSRTLPLLLKLAIADDRPLHSSPDHALRVIKDWIKSAPRGTGDCIGRRRMLLMCVHQWFEAHLDLSIGVRALVLALLPRFEDHELVPGEHQSFTVRRGVVLLDELKEVALLWPEVLAMLKQYPPTNWEPVFEAVDKWVYCGQLSIELSEEYLEVFAATAEVMLRELAAAFSSQPGVRKQLRVRSQHLGISLELSPEGQFDVLYPDEERGRDRHDRDHRQIEAAKSLAVEWARSKPTVVAKDIAAFAAEARNTGRNFPDYSRLVCALIAKECTTPLDWLDALMAVDADAEHLLPFAHSVAKQRPTGWHERITVCLSNEKWQGTGVNVVLGSPDVDLPLRKLCIDTCRKVPNLVENLFSIDQVDESHFSDLLITGHPQLSEAAAIGLWHRNEKNPIPDYLNDKWRQAVIKFVRNEYYLGKMFEAIDGLANDWMAYRAALKDEEYHSLERAFEAASSRLTAIQREAIIDQVNPQLYQARMLIRSVVGAKPDTYRHLLTKSLPNWLHRAPLLGSPTLDWAELAGVALEAGLSPNEIVSTAIYELDAGMGSFSNRYEKQLEQWDKLKTHSNPRIQDLARLGESAARQEMERWQRDEKKEKFDEYYL